MKVLVAWTQQADCADAMAQSDDLWPMYAADVVPNARCHVVPVVAPLPPFEPSWALPASQHVPIASKAIYHASQKERSRPLKRTHALQCLAPCLNSGPCCCSLPSRVREPPSSTHQRVRPWRAGLPVKTPPMSGPQPPGNKVSCFDVRPCMPGGC
jgi:hypothetical protein